MSDTALIDRDEAVATAITDGRSLRRIQRDFSLTEAELDAALEKSWPVNNDARIRMIKHDLARLERVIEVLFEKSIAGDVNASIACIRGWERKAALLGLDSAQRIDLQVIKPPEHKSQHQRISEVIQEFWNRMTPAERELRDRLNGMNAEKALELLDRLGNGDGAALAPSSREPIATGTDRERDTDAT